MSAAMCRGRPCVARPCVAGSIRAHPAPGDAMRPLVIVGIVLIIVGLVALAYGGFSFTTTEKVAEIGPLKVEREKTRSIALPPVLGAAAIVVGVVLAVAGARRS